MTSSFQTGGQPLRGPSTAAVPHAGSEEPRRLTVLILLQVVIGFACGSTLFGTWHLALEPAQALAGFVELPHWNPNYLYQRGLWTLINQVPAVALRAGITERTLAFVISGLAASLSFTSLALIVYALSRRTLVAAAAPLVVICARGLTVPGLSYPIAWFGTSHTYAVFGIGIVLLVIALFAAGRTRSALFWASIAPALHPSCAIWLAVILAIFLLTEREWITKALFASWPTWLTGTLITVISFAARQRSKIPAPGIDDERYFGAFLQLWDYHRRRFDFASPAAFEIATAVVWALILLRERGGDATFVRARRLLAAAILTSVAVGVPLSFSYWLPPDRAPQLLVALMPSRMPNVAQALALPVAIGYLAFRRRDVALSAATLVFAVIPSFFASIHRVPEPLLDRMAPGWRGLADGRHAETLTLTVCTVLALFGLLLSSGIRFRRETVARLTLGMALLAAGSATVMIASRSVSPQFLGRYSLARLVAIIGMAAIAGALWITRQRLGRSDISARRRDDLPSKPLLLTGALALAGATVLLKGFHSRTPLRDRTNDPLWRTVASRSGIVVTSPDQRIVQLRSRRPVLLDPASLDFVPFTPGSGAGVDRILRRVYGVDLFNRTGEQVRRTRGGLGLDEGRQLFESRTPEEWQSLRREFAVTDVVCDPGWRLQLPVISSDEEARLYSIPDLPEARPLR